MSKKNKNGDEFDINRIQSYINSNSIESEPLEYNAQKMAVFGANVNLMRHLLDIKDGLKPIHRRLLMVMYENKLFPNVKEEAKCASIIGDVLKKYHPHGDAAAYTALVYLGQSWRNNVQLVNTDTNFGSAFEPNGYAHYRYTSAKLSEFAYDCFFSQWDLGSYKDDKTVDWMQNFDNSRLEPMYLPAKYPLFLLNFHTAMGLGRYTSTLGFNPTDAFNAVIKLVEDKDAKFDMYPDDPQGCKIINRKDIIDILDRTEVKVKFRADYRVTEYKGKEVIEIENVPFEVSPITVRDAIIKLQEKGFLPEISDLSGCSIDNGTKFRLSIEIKKGYSPKDVMDKLYKKTQLEETYTTYYSFVDSLQSVDYTLRTAILEWIRYRRETIKRLYKIKRINALKRMHFLIPLIKVIKSGEIDKFIYIVRHNKKDDAILKISEQFNLTDYQAEKIVGVRISDLSEDSLEEYEKELAELTVAEEKYGEIVKSKKKINKIIINEMKEGIEKYGTPRKSKVTQLCDRTEIEDSTHYLIFTNKYVKKLPYDNKSYKIGRVDNGEKVMKVMVVNNTAKIAIFTTDGRCIPIEVHQINNSAVQSVGVALSQYGAKANFVSAFEMNDSYSDKCIVTVTKTGLISKTLYEEISDKAKPFALMKIGKNDEMRDVAIASDKDELLVYTVTGKCNKFSSSDFETTARNTKGVLSIRTEDNIRGVISIPKDAQLLVTLTDRGYMKKFPIKSMPETKRNNKPIDIDNGNGYLIKCKAINDRTTAMFIYTTDGVCVIDPINIKAKSRIGKNTRVVEMKSSAYAFDLE